MGIVTVHSDAALDELLAELARSGESRADMTRRAIRDAVRLQRREEMRREALECASDDADRAEAQAVLSEVEDLRAW